MDGRDGQMSDTRQFPQQSTRLLVGVQIAIL